MQRFTKQIAMITNKTKVSRPSRVKTKLVLPILNVAPVSVSFNDYPKTEILQQPQHFLVMSSSHTDNSVTILHALPSDIVENFGMSCILCSLRVTGTRFII